MSEFMTTLIMTKTTQKAIGLLKVAGSRTRLERKVLQSIMSLFPVDGISVPGDNPGEHGSRPSRSRHSRVAQVSNLKSWQEYELYNGQVEHRSENSKSHARGGVGRGYRKRRVSNLI